MNTKTLIQIKIKGTIGKLCWNIIRWTSSSIPTDTGNLPDLCPTDQADHVGVYMDRLEHLLTKKHTTIREIAITAPYSGGKSSLINTFKRLHPYHIYTSISLASFNEVKNPADIDKESLTTHSSQSKNYNPAKQIDKIEKSIVQQILYRTESKKTPFSRFRRIYPAPPSWGQCIFISSSLIAWTISIWLIKNDPAFSLDTALLEKPFNLDFISLKFWVATYALSLPILIVADLYRQACNLTIAKINPLKGEIALDQKKNDSIFNIYLEEIIYYFSLTKSDVVFFEDLDRFERTDIFVKLKELNKLINFSSDVTQNVTFIYAIRDNIFKGKDRTKFFDSIIPIIPITSKSNSYPQLLALIGDADFAADFSDHYLRDISIYIDDMRILKNIVTEYGIYKKTLIKSFTKINTEKLFSFMVYKNIYCDDFADLHENEGILAGVFKKSSIVKSKEEKKLNAEIKSAEMKLAAAWNERTESVEELNSKYVLHLMEKLLPNPGISHIQGRSVYDIPQEEIFNELSEQKTPIQFTFNGGVRGSNIIFSQYFSEYSPDYETRKKRIINKGKSIQNQLKTTIKQNIELIQSLSAASVRDLANGNAREFLFQGIDDQSLLSHMIEKGYIDEHYHLYITHFIEGHMTKSDLDYVMSVKHKTSEDPNKEIDNPSETMTYFSDEEYRTNAFLNYKIVDFLIRSNHLIPLKILIKHSIKNSENRISIINDSLTGVVNKASWLDLITTEWPEVFTDVVSSIDTQTKDKNTILAIALQNLSDYKEFSQVLHGKTQLADYIGRNEEIFEGFPTLEKERTQFFQTLAFMGVVFQDLSKCSNDNAFVLFILEYQLFFINTENLIIVLKSIKKPNLVNNIDFSQIRLIQDPSFESLIEENIEDFAKLIADKEISISDVQDIVNLLNNEDIELETIVKIIANIKFKITNISCIATDEILNSILNYKRFNFSWENILTITRNEKIGEEDIYRLLNYNKVREALCAEALSTTREDQKENFDIISNKNINADNFLKYFEYFEFQLAEEDILNLSQEKIKKLIEFNHIRPSIEIYNSLLSIDNNLSNTLLEKHFEFYFGTESSELSTDLSIDSSTFYFLLGSNKLTIPEKRNLFFSHQILTNLSFDNSKLVEIISTDIKTNYISETEIPHIHQDLLLPLIDTLGSDKRKEIAIGQIQYLDTTQINILLAKLGKGFSDIPNTKSYAKIDNTKLNFALAATLKKHNFISSLSAIPGDKSENTAIKINVKRK